MPEGEYGGYSITLVIIEIVEAVAIAALMLMVIKLWREIEVPETK